MRVCIIGSMPPYKNAGPATYVDGLSRELAKKIEVCIISPGPKNMEYIDKHNRKIYIIKEGRFWTLRAVIMAWKLRSKYDILHVNHVLTASAAHFIIKKPTVLTVHGYYVYELASMGKVKNNTFSYKIRLNVEKKAMKKVDAIIAVDKRIYEWIINNLKVNKNKISHMPNAVDPTKFDPNIDAQNLKEKLNLLNYKILLFLKGLVPKNGPEILIKSMYIISKKRPNTKLLIIGNGPLKKKLQEMVKKMNLSNKILFLDTIPNDLTPFYYAISDIVILPSVPISDVEEATSITMLEALCMEKPVIASNIGGLKEIIDNRKIGILFRYGDYFDLAKKIIYVLDHPKYAKEMGKKAREYIIKNHTWEKNAEKVLKIYETLQP